MCDLETYKCSDEGLLLPLVNEYTWDTGARAFVYLIGLFWSFMGVSIIADIFMQSIEMITSRTSVVIIADPDSSDGSKEVHVKTWNNTVANLTLMALGSSAPEILLSIIEIVGNSFEAGALGPGTIVGSAAFNLFVITGVCVMSIPTGEGRRIKAIKVFAITAFFCVFAYVWLVIILVAITPDFVDLWEAVVTLLFFPLLVILAYMADKEFCCKSAQVGDVGEEQAEFGLGDKGDVNMIEGMANKESVAGILKKMGNRPDLTEEDEARIATALIAKKTPHTRAWYRINAIRMLTSGHKLVPSVNEKQAAILESLEQGEDVGSTVSLGIVPGGGYKAVVEWAAGSTAVLESDGRAKLVLMRHGNTDVRVIVRVETVDGTAEADSDYKPIDETLVFTPGQTSKEIHIEIIDDNEYEPDEVFFVRVTMDPEEPATIGNKSICQVTIVNDDDPGVFEFSKPSFVFKESAGKALVEVKRLNGCSGKASVNWQTKDRDGKGAAVAGRDYVGGSGVLAFEHGELVKTIEIEIIDDQEYEKDEHFDVLLTGCSDGSKLGSLKRTVVTILNDDEFKGVVSRIVNLTNANLDQISVAHSTWSQQFTDAMNVNGGDIEGATKLDYLMHFLTFGWKVIFAIVPPAQIWGGWLAFFISLAMIGILTAIIGDLASIFGCLIGLKPTVTAITFVALGTSLPDLFASKTAAQQEEHADNSIGNVTGSNSVNVFLGLGLPWTIAAVYWTAKDTTFEVPAGNLSFGVIVYTVCAITTITLLLVRRGVPSLGKNELGGPKVPKIVCGVILMFLWFLYVILSSLQAYDILETQI
ncbi:hypothetical protein RRG08_010672 [Elysia crispata]|uniref:Calx-beta domain-containing protein n=1 Tax=Elysia crispata TaxID=231223 RepID=A0AAE0Z0J7_9GAST|nr:hypothetical protein RRG08_010672 [Elysia crispata]